MTEPEQPDREADDVLNLTDEDRLAIDFARRTARRLLDHQDATPQVIAAVGFALHALDKFPHVEEGLRVELSISYRCSGEMRCVDVRISDCAFEISPGGSVDFGCGADSLSDPGYRLETTGYVERSCDLCELEETVNELLNMGADVDATVEGGDFEAIGWEEGKEQRRP